MDKTIGEIFKEKRKLRGLTLQQIHRDTRIPIHYLTALEENNPDMFPAKVYYLASLRKYSQYLDLDINTILRQQEDKEKEEKQKPSVSSPKGKSAVVFDYKAISGIIGVFVFVGILAYGYVNWVYQTRVEKSIIPIQRQQQPIVVPTPEKNVDSAITNSTYTAGTQKKVKRHILEMRALVSTWVRVVADDKLVFEGKLNPDRKMRWEARRGFMLRVGYVRGVEVKFNGEIVDLVSGSRADVNEITLPMKKQKIEESGQVESSSTTINKSAQ